VSPKDSAQYILDLPDPTATYQLGHYLGSVLTAGSVILLEGNLGSGKTSLVQGLGRGLGIQEAIDSPTFTLVNEYLSGRVPLYHLDLYRLDPDAIAALYLEQYWDGSEIELGIVAIEWAERLKDWPDRYLHIQLDIAPNQGRQANLRLYNLTISGQEQLIGWTRQPRNCNA